MASSYPDELSDWVKRRVSSKADSPVASFLAVRDDVEAAIVAGFPMKTIWTQMKERQCLTVCYDTFRSYVHRYISNRKNDMPLAGTSSPVAPVWKANNVPLLRPAETGASPIAGFTFNPHPKKEDLI